MELETLQDLRRDAEDILYTEIAVHIKDLALEDLPTRDEIHMLREFDNFDEEKWSAIYQVETNLEKLYEVTYNFETNKFYVTTYLMAFCKKYDPPNEY